MTRYTRTRVADEVTTAARHAWAAVAASRDRNRQLVPGISSLLGCARAAWFGHHGEPPTDEPDPTPAAEIGTMIHDGFLPKLKRTAGGEIEIPVRLTFDVDGEPVTLPGHADYYRSPHLVDVKTVGAHALQRMLRDGPKRQHLAQVWGYATAVNAMHPGWVEWCTLLYIERDGGDMHTRVYPYAELDDMVRDDVHAWVADVADRAYAPARGERGPGLSVVCDGCRWLKACWGPDATRGVTGPQSELADTPAGVVNALDLYADGAARESAAKADKAFASAVLRDTDPGDYGPYKLTRTRGSERLDQTRAVARMEAFGVEVPRITVAGSMRVTRKAKP